MSKIISVFNNKGGVGKTTITWNLGQALADLDKHVLFIDLDPQCNLSLAFLGDTIFKDKLPNENLPYGKTIRAWLQQHWQRTGPPDLFTHKGKHTNTNVEIVAGDFWLNVYAESLSYGSDLLTGSGIGKYVFIKELVKQANLIRMNEIGSKFDFVLLDLPPSFGALVRVAVYSSDYYIIPCSSDTFSAYCIGLIAQMFPKFFKEWKTGLENFKFANPNFIDYDNLGSSSFAGWVFNGFDTREGIQVKADQVHGNKIKEAIQNEILDQKSDIIPRCATITAEPIGTIEDMNVLVQNSIWLNVPISELKNFTPIRSIVSKGAWASNQRDQIDTIASAFKKLAKNIIKISN